MQAVAVLLEPRAAVIDDQHWQEVQLDVGGGEAVLRAEEAAGLGDR